ncbi:hypothetical protein [uncultured Campylobacter sp.]|uniref:hypothetical protein n=1 Tax=uncultured Campylobacter sp. TaxID=218934 RepID=UPI00260CC609|nr:hypothetical protein [uncultured Campylobacter sp.]
MPIPFLAGFAIGCAALYAYNNRDKIKEGASKIANSKSVEELKNSVKESAEKLSKKSKEILKDAKESLNLEGAEGVKKTRKKPGPKPGSKKAAAASASKTAASKTAAAGKTRKKPEPKPGSKRAKNTAASASGSTKKRASTAKAASISIPQVVSPNDNFNASQPSADKSQK